MQISLDNKNLSKSFLLGIILTIAMPVIEPSIKLTFFSPFLIIACYQKPLKTCLWLAFWCGLFIDLLSDYSRIGLYASDYCLTLVLLYPQRRHFFSDSLSTLPIMAFIFSLLSAFIMAVVLYGVEMKSVFSWPWTIHNLLIIPCLDAAYAFLFFILPPLLFGKKRRKGRDYFLHG